MIPEIDRLYVYDQSQFGLKAEMPDINSKVQKSHYRFKKGNFPQKSAEYEVIRFAQTVIIGDNKNTLMFITKNPDVRQAESFILDSVSKIMLNPSMLEVFKEANRTPKPLSLFYGS